MVTNEHATGKPAAFITAFWNICDSLAGEVGELAAAQAFIFAADELAVYASGEWAESEEYRQAVETVKRAEGGNHGY